MVDHSVTYVVVIIFHIESRRYISMAFLILKYFLFNRSHYCRLWENCERLLKMVGKVSFCECDDLIEKILDKFAEDHKEYVVWLLCSFRNKEHLRNE